MSRYAAAGNVFLDLEVIEELTAQPHIAFDRLVDLAPVAFRADWGVRVAVTDGRLKLLHHTSAAPDLDDEQACWLPLDRAARLDVRPEWAQLADNVIAGAPLAPDEAIVLGRRGGPSILDSEIARLGHLAALAVTISAGR